MGSLREFMALSELLTGLDRLDPAVGDDYRRRLEMTPGLALDDLLGAYRAATGGKGPLAMLIAQFDGDPDGQRLRFAAQQVVRIWYLSEFFDPGGGLQSGGHFLDAALYRVIDAHTPGYSDLPHGYWTKPPHPAHKGDR